MSTAVLTMPQAPEVFEDEAAAAQVAETAEGGFYEIVDGRRVEIASMSVYAANVASRLCIELGLAARASNLGAVVVENLFRIPLDEDRSRNRQPDVAFVSYDRWPADKPLPLTDNAWDVVPDLAIEVVSPTDVFENVIGKAREYLRGGVKLVWVVSPVERVAFIFEDPMKIHVVVENEMLDGVAVVPGFRIALASLLDAPQPVVSMAE